MTYQTGGNIDNVDYNSIADALNNIYADKNSGATLLTNASYGYGKSALFASIADGAPITASEWASLFTVIKNCGNHQGTTVVPPLPGSVPGYDAGNVLLPAPGNNIVAYNPANAMTTLINTLTANRFNLYAGQTAIVDPTTYSAPVWTTSLTYTFTANFGSWNNARYFFNAGGAIRISGAHPNGTGDNAEWNGMLSSMSPFVFNYNASTPSSGSPGGIGGFWNTGTSNPLTTSYQALYTQTYSLNPYSGSYIQISARLGAAAGASGSEVITFRVYFLQADSGTLFSSKTGTSMTPGYRYSPSGTAVPTAAPILTSLGSQQLNTQNNEPPLKLLINSVNGGFSWKND